MTQQDATGYAAINEGIINVKTVSETRRAAIVDFLVVSAGVMVGAHATDEWIEDAWRRYGGTHEIVQVVIREVGT